MSTGIRSGVHRPTFLKAHGESLTGHTVSFCEDAYAISEYGLLVLADGVGTSKSGWVASQTAVQHFQTRLSLADHLLQFAPNGTGSNEAWIAQGRQWCLDGVEGAQLCLEQKVSENTSLLGMATTIVAVLCAWGNLVVVHKGDSRAYLWTPLSLGDRLGNFERLTADHTALRDPRYQGIPRDILLKKGIAHKLTRALSTKPDGTNSEPAIDHRSIVLPGSRLLLVSDGVHKAILDEELEQLLLEGDDPQKIVSRIVRAAHDAGSNDDITAVMGIVLQ